MVSEFVNQISHSDLPSRNTQHNTFFGVLRDGSPEGWRTCTFSDLMSSSSSECSDRSSPAACSDDSDGSSFAHSVHVLPENALPPSAAPGSIAAMMAEVTVAAAQPAVAGSLGAMFASDSDEEPPPNETCSEQRLSLASSAPHRAQTATSRAAAASADDGDSDSDDSENGKDSDDNEADSSGYDSDFCDNTRQRVTSIPSHVVSLFVVASECV